MNTKQILNSYPMWEIRRNDITLTTELRMRKGTMYITIAVTDEQTITEGFMDAITKKAMRQMDEFVKQKNNGK